MGAESVADGNVEADTESVRGEETKVSLTNDKAEETASSANNEQPEHHIEESSGDKEELVLEVYTKENASEEKLTEKLVVEIFTENKPEETVDGKGIGSVDIENKEDNMTAAIPEEPAVEKKTEEPVFEKIAEQAFIEKIEEAVVEKKAGEIAHSNKAEKRSDESETKESPAKFTQQEALPIPKQGATQRRKSTFIKPADKSSAEKSLESFLSGKRSGKLLAEKIAEEPPIEEKAKAPSEEASSDDESGKFKQQEPLPIPKQGATQRRKSTFIKPADKSSAEKNLESFFSGKGRSRFSAIREDIAIKEEGSQTLSVRKPRSSPRPSPRSSPRPSPRTSPRSSPTPKHKFGAERLTAPKNDTKPISKKEPGKSIPKPTNITNKLPAKPKEVAKKPAAKLPMTDWAYVDEAESEGRDVIRVFDHESGQSVELGESHLEHQIKSLRNQRRGVDDDKQDPFMGLNLGVMKSRVTWWRDHLPQIEPCADCMMISGLTPVTKVLNGAGCWFYALSKKELKDLIDVGVDPKKIIFGQTVKQEAHLQYAKANDVGYVAFDSAFELHKIRKDYKDAKLLIRACLTEPDQPIPKYGRNVQSCQDILNTARMLGLQVAGVICVIKDPSTPKDIKEACTMIRNIFQYADKSLGYKMNIVMVKFNIDRDLSEEESFVELAGMINRNFLTSFRSLFGNSGPGKNAGIGVKIIVDPGEFFVKDSVSLAASIIGVRRLGSKDNRKVYYYVNESIYQSFAHVRVKPTVKYVPKVLFYTSKIKSQKGEVEATVYGYSDDEADCLSKGCELPVDMCNGDMLAFYGLGPYVKSFESDWMINNAVVYYFCSTEDVTKLLEWVPKAVHNEDKGTMFI